MALRPRAPRTPVNLVAGVDEAGRGCLAGPVVAGAVIFAPRRLPSGLADSKRLSPQKRKILAAAIKDMALAWSLGVVWPKRVDEINVLQASLEAMARAVNTLRLQPGMALIDGLFVIPETAFTRAPPRQKAIIKGDALVPAISAASIVAKTFRDKLMRALARRWPQYGFEKHAGYGTRRHFEALDRFGPCPLHRMTFRGVATPRETWGNLPLKEGSD